MRVTRIAAALAGAAVALPALAVAPALPASAAGPGEAVPRLMLSDDGAVWERHLSSSLFGDQLLLVPGGTATESFWVKNLSGVPAVLRTSVADVRSSSPALTRWLSVTTSPLDGLGGTSTVALGDGTCTGSVSATVLGGGDEVLLDVGLALDERATEGAAGQSVDFTVLVTLTGLVAGAAPTAGCATPDDDAVATVPALGPGASGPVAPGAARAGGGGGSSARTPVDASIGTETGAEADGPGLVPSADGDLRTAGIGAPRPFELTMPFVPVPLRGAWLPVAAGLLAVLVGGAVALMRRRGVGDDDGQGAEAGEGDDLAGDHGAPAAGPGATA